MNLGTSNTTSNPPVSGRGGSGLQRDPERNCHEAPKDEHRGTNKLRSPGKVLTAEPHTGRGGHVGQYNVAIGIASGE